MKGIINFDGINIIVEHNEPSAHNLGRILAKQNQ